MVKNDYDLINIRITQIIINNFNNSKFNQRSGYLNYIKTHIDNGIAIQPLTMLYSEIILELNTIFGFSPKDCINLITNYFKKKYYIKFWDLAEMYNIIETISF